MFSEAKVTEIFCMANDFCKFFAKIRNLVRAQLHHGADAPPEIQPGRPDQDQGGESESGEETA